MATFLGRITHSQAEIVAHVDTRKTPVGNFRAHVLRKLSKSIDYRVCSHALNYLSDFLEQLAQYRRQRG